jgi:hypothetical protein
MVANKKQSTIEKRRKAKVTELKLNKETVKELPDSLGGEARGGKGPVLKTTCCGAHYPEVVIE